MSHAAHFAVSAAVLLCVCSTIFGVAMARLVWNEDLQHAIHIDEIRSQTEHHLREQIAHMEATIAILEKQPPTPPCAQRER
jgi:hypothetical protein